MSDCIVQCKQVTVKQQGRTIFSNLDLQIYTDKICAVIGPSGVGKTTILRLITGQIKPSSGEVFFQNKSLAHQSLAELYERRKQIGMVFQSSALFPDLNIFDNIALPLTEHLNLTQSQLTERVESALKAVDLVTVGDLFPWQLSGGMQKRAAIARASILMPALMLYDEPLAGQDPITSQNLLALIEHDGRKNGHSAIIVSHELEQVLPISDQVVMLHHDGVIFSGSVSELLACSHPYVKSFLNNVSLNLKRSVSC